jgi:hypothetical protein
MKTGVAKMNVLKTICVGAVAFFAASSIAFAQAPTTNGNGCTPQERSNKTLEHDQSNAGVICPPEIDSGMMAPAPRTGDSSVIPPPRAAEGDPNVKPK